LTLCLTLIVAPHIVIPGAAHGLPVSDGRRYLDELALFFINRR